MDDYKNKCLKKYKNSLKSSLHFYRFPEDWQEREKIRNELDKLEYLDTE